ncbi:MAG TPA: amino acid ABC transporter ATP-binding protein, partial [Acidimicrobiia bacterium]|nr:amino acid ABC transporter ATP-binding protein [Acidimicrobiia bacterium]
MTEPTSRLRISGLTKTFGDLTVLADVSLELQPHEVVCLIGASGSGKSTLLKAVNLLVPIDQGEIFLDDVAITGPEVDANQVRSRMGIVFQSFNLFPHLTILDNITLAPRKVLKLDRAAAEGRAMELLGRFDLLDKVKDYPDRLSGGQQQRVAIIRSLAMQPELMLLDEVTSALDPVLVGEVLECVRELKGQGMTMLIATHEMGFARNTADRVAFLHSGTVWEQGPPQRVLGEPDRPETQEFLGRI